VAYRKGNPELRQAFLHAGQTHDVEAHWHECDADNASVTATVRTAARRADLIVLAQKDRTSH